ncbi:MAG: alpha/beta hydrolase [Sandaracinaceae bacterium]|nr:alpha/beta hydrolase [Myxococcales bacterium]MCB9656458.1 alpha/beta hydrolase [Sandaracinaceae bacterium]
MPFVPLRDGARLHVRVVGRGEPVLLLPGLGMASHHWLPFVLPHARRFRFYMPDFRGHGRSRAVRVQLPDVFQSHADDVQDVIAHFGLTDFLLAGVSLGATTALHLQRETGFVGVRAYLHIDQSPNVLNDADWQHGLAGVRQAELVNHMRAARALLDQHPDATYFHQLPRGAREPLASVLAELLGVLGAPPRRTGFIRRALPRLPGPVVQRVPLLHLDDMRTYLRAYSGGGHDYRPTLGLGDTPVTLMVGMNSPLYPVAGQELVATQARRGRVVRFHRSGHVPLLDEPVRFQREFSRFLRQAP